MRSLVLLKMPLKIPDCREKRALASTLPAETRVRKEGAVSRNLVNFLFWFTHLFFINHLLLSLAYLLITIVSGEVWGEGWISDSQRVKRPTAPFPELKALEPRSFTVRKITVDEAGPPFAIVVPDTSCQRQRSFS